VSILCSDATATARGRNRLRRVGGLSTIIAGMLLCAGWPAAAAHPEDGPAWVTLGTGGGPLVRIKRGNTSNALVVGQDVILFDAGEGVVHGLAAAGLRLDQVRAIVLSHLHPDHTAGLATLITLRWQNNLTAPIVVYGPVGTSELVAGILASNKPAERAGYAAPGAAIPSADRSVSARELACTGESTAIGAVQFVSIGNTHYLYPDGREPSDARSCAFRVTVGGRSVVYTGDTGPSDAVTKLAKGADLLVSEVIDISATMKALRAVTQAMKPEARDAMIFHLTHHHLTPEDVGRMAAAASVGEVVLTHLAPGLDGEQSTSGYVDGVRRLYHGSVIAASDGDRFPLKMVP